MTDPKSLRENLEAELREVLGQHTRLSAHLRNADRDVPIDWTEAAQFLENDEVLEALESRARERVDALTGALLRLEQGTYGTCATCGKPIVAERLEILPTTRVCASCA